MRLEDRSSLIRWLLAERGLGDDTSAPDSVTATFVIDEDGYMRVAARRSEHVKCASGRPVRSAGEVTFALDGNVIAISKHSTGYCPEPESWGACAEALDRIPLSHPGQFTTALEFRLCRQCKQRNVIKDGWYFCDICGAKLPEKWNFPEHSPDSGHVE